MELLKEHNLYGGGLIEVDDPPLVARYNRCLEEIGETPTCLASFQIDGRGWSPEIAAEKGNQKYLSHGGAVQYAIILTPEQRDKPIYNPIFSFERRLLHHVFEQTGDAIARLTGKTGLWIQIDPGLTEIRRPADLLMISKVSILLRDPLHLVAAALSQKLLVDKFSSDRNAWMDETLRDQLIDSGRKHGDLRFIAPSFMGSYDYEQTACFYTPLFGGTFLIRWGKKKLLVMEEDNSLAVSIKNRSLLSCLFQTGLLAIPMELYRKSPNLLREMQMAILVSIIYQKKPDIDFLHLPEPQKERLVMEHKGELPKEFFALERLERCLASGGTVSESRLPLSVKWLLARPKNELPAYVSEMLWKLICRVAPVPISTRFVYDKEGLYRAYGLWPEAQKRWAVQTILSTGLVPRRHV
jgi:hypothetical protein